MEANPTTIFDQLEIEHKGLKKLLKQTEDAKPSERQELFKQICEELVPHARGEEKTIYAVLRERAKKENVEDALDIANEAYEEHRVADQLVQDLKNLSFDSERWGPVFKVLKENLEHHIEEEESELWRQSRKMFSHEEQKNLLGVYLIAKAKYSEVLPDQHHIHAREASAATNHAL